MNRIYFSILFKTTYFMKIISTIFICLFFGLFSIVSCKSSQQMNKFSVNEDGFIEAQQNTMNKDGIRLQGIILTKGKIVGERLVYEMQVDQIVSMGATFASVEPRQGERVELITLKTIKFKINSKVIVDAFTPMKREDGMLTLDMIKN